MTSKLGGRGTKDASITDNFNQKKKRVITKEEWREIGKRGGRPRRTDKQGPNDLKAAYDMLLHMRFAYRNSKGPTGKKGKQRLVELMNNDADFKFAVKELLKIESALLSAKIRKEGDGAVGGSNQNFFVVLKGLETEKTILEAMKDNSVDMKQIQRAMNPDEHSYEPEEEVNQRGAPEQLHKSLDTEE